MAVAVASTHETIRGVVEPSSSTRRQRAVKALVVLLGVAVAVQMLSVPLADYAIAKLVAVVPPLAGMDTNTQWQAYLNQRDAPETLFVGDSQAFLDVDTASIATSMSTAASPRHRIGKIGIAAAGPEVLDALMYRLTTRPQRPRVIVLELQGFEFNTHWHWDPTADLWQLSTPLDPGFMQIAFRLDPNRGRLLRAWIAPYFMAYAPLGTLAQCYVAGASRLISLGLTRHAPAEFRGPTACDSGQALLDLNHYQADGAAYQLSESRADMIREAVSFAHKAGVKVIFIQYPRLDAGGANALGDEIFQREARSLASSLSVPLYDLTGAIMPRSDLWYDQTHLAPAGARALAPRLAWISTQ